MAFDDRLDAPYSQPFVTRPARRRRRWLERLLLLGFLLCLLVGLGALVMLWRLTTTPTTEIRFDDPLASLRTERIVPALTLAELAGDPADALAYQALVAGQLETARALLTSRRQANGAMQLGISLQMARHYVQDGENSIAELLYHQARAVTLLDGQLGSLERGQALAQIAQGLEEIKASAAARDATIQAFRVARQAPDLLPVQRNQLFTSLRPLVQEVGDAELRQQVAEFIRNPFLVPPGKEPTFGGLWALVEPVAPDGNVMTAVATRQQRARELTNRLAFTGGADINPERAALAQALLAEDQVRRAFISNLQRTNLPPSQQISLYLEQRDWLLLKLRIAARGFGLSLVPEWEAGQGALVRDLAAVNAALDNGFQALTAAQTDPVEQAVLRLEARRWLALQSELGQYPGAAQDLLGQRLGESQSTLAQLGRPLALPLRYEAAAIPPGFRIEPSQ